MNTPTEQTSHVKLAEDLLDRAIDLITERVSASATAAYAEIRDRLVADVRAGVSTGVIERLTDETVFVDRPALTSMPPCRDPLPDEKVVVDSRQVCDRETHIITNYGRYLYAGQILYFASVRLTEEVIDLIVELIDTALSAADLVESITCVLANYAKHAYRVNRVHDDKIKAIRDEIESDLAARRIALDNYQARLDAAHAANINSAIINEQQARLLAIDIEEHTRRVAASTAHEKTHDDLVVERRQIELVKAQWAKYVLRLAERERELAAEDQRLRALKQELDRPTSA